MVQPWAHALDTDDRIRELEMEAAVFEAEAVARRREANRLRQQAGRSEIATAQAASALRSAGATPTGADKRRLQRAHPILSPRQLEVAILIARGFSNRQIAEHMVIAVGTVANHVASVLDRLGLANRVQIAGWAMQQFQTGLGGEWHDPVPATWNEDNKPSTRPAGGSIARSRAFHSSSSTTSHWRHPVRRIEDE